MSANPAFAVPLQTVVADFVVQAVQSVDQAAAALVLPLACWILLSGLDDLLVLLVFLRHRWISPPPPPRTALGAVPPRPIAIFVPCWQEAGVIGDMVEHNRCAIRYPAYDFFIGAYPNDEPTIEAARRLESRHPKVHLCLCPHDGPTSKADCLNWIYQRMLLHEEERRCRFEAVLTHDAEDLIHPDELSWINYHLASHDMVQIPVLPLPTPLAELTHGLYCDDFAECHTKDLVARQALGGFLPSSGVGAGYARRALDRLAASEANRIFEPVCLTEDYENGYRLHRLGCRQLFMPIRLENGAPVATREYFPRTFATAVKQRTRWVMGIALQAWERHGWSPSPRQSYWMWRDRKGLIGNPVSLLANLVFAWGAATWISAAAAGAAWGFGDAVRDPGLRSLLAANLALQAIHLSARAGCVARIFGWRFALAAPLRAVWGNWLNTVATVQAVTRFAGARLRGEPLRWVKTEHAYPSRAALLPHKRPLEEILVGSAYLTTEDLELARATKPRGVRLTEHLVQAGFLAEDERSEAHSLPLGLALGRIEPDEVRRSVARSLPAHVVREWHVLPLRIESGSLHLASIDVPSDELRQALRRFTRLDIRVQVVTPTNFHRLARALL